MTIFEEQYRDLRPRAPIPPLDIRFRRFTSLNTTIRLREGCLHVRLSDLERAMIGIRDPSRIYEYSLDRGASALLGRVFP